MLEATCVLSGSLSLPVGWDLWELGLLQVQKQHSRAALASSRLLLSGLFHGTEIYFHLVWAMVFEYLTVNTCKTWNPIKIYDRYVLVPRCLSCDAERQKHLLGDALLNKAYCDAITGLLGFSMGYTSGGFRYVQYPINERPCPLHCSLKLSNTGLTEGGKGQ